MNGAEISKMERYIRATRSRALRSAGMLTHAHVGSTPTQHELRWLLGYDASLLAGDLLRAVEGIAALITDPDQVADLRQQARDVEGAFRRSALAAKLSNIEGRTPEETAAFLAKAEELRT